MKLLTTALLLAVTAITLLTVSLSEVHDNFTRVVEMRGGADQVSPDLLLFWNDITEDDLRSEDPEGFALLADIAHTPDRTVLVNEWMIETRHLIFERRYGRPYRGQIAR